MVQLTTFEVIFDGEVLGKIEAPNLPYLIATLLELQICRGTSMRDRCPVGNGLHAHFPVRRFDPRPVRRGDLDFFVARLPRLGEVSYHFDAEHSVAPPITFRAASP